MAELSGLRSFPRYRLRGYVDAMQDDQRATTVRNATSDWREKRVVFGLYVVRCTKPGFADRVRVGAGGNKKGKDGLYARLTSHEKPWRTAPDNETNKLAPFEEVVMVWALDGWTAEQVGDGEKALWLAFAKRFPKHRGTLRDKSTFIVPVGERLEGILAEVEADLDAFAAVHALPNPVVEVPHEVTAVRRGPRQPRRRSAPPGPAAPAT